MCSCTLCVWKVVILCVVMPSCVGGWSNSRAKSTRSARSTRKQKAIWMATAKGDFVFLSVCLVLRRIASCAPCGVLTPRQVAGTELAGNRNANGGFSGHPLCATLVKETVFSLFQSQSLQKEAFGGRGTWCARLALPLLKLLAPRASESSCQRIDQAQSSCPHGYFGWKDWKGFRMTTAMALKIWI